jgi:hypothetical protein
LRNEIIAQKTLPLILILIFLFVGCEDSTSPLERGLGKVNITGNMTKSFTGKAVFENKRAPMSGNVFFLIIRDTNLPEDQHSFVQFSGSRPAVGTYNIINLEEKDSEDGLLVGRFSDSEIYGSYNSNGGTIEITYESGTEMKGLFDFSAYQIISKSNGESEKEEINISGEFYAEEGSTGIEIE